MMELRKQEQEALQRIKEMLEEFPDSRIAQYIQSEDLRTIVKLIEKSAKK